MPANDSKPADCSRLGRGARRATSYDVARLAGVSQSAVSRALRTGTPASEETRAKVRAAAERLGYAPSNVARSLITRRSRTVGVILTVYTTRNFPDLLPHLGAAIEAAGSRMLVFTIENEAAAAALLPDLLAYHVDGVLSGASLPAAMVEALAHQGVPVVLYNRAPASGAFAVGCDDARAMDALVDHLVAGGIRRAAFVAGPAGAPVSRARCGAAGRALARHNLAFERVVRADYAYEGGRAAGQALFAGSSAAARLDTVVCANDAMALGIIDALRHDRGLRVPQDVAVSGFDDVPQAAWPPYALTTLRQPVDAMAQAAVGMLGEAAGGRRLMPADLMVRGSTRPARRDPSNSQETG